MCCHLSQLLFGKSTIRGSAVFVMLHKDSYYNKNVSALHDCYASSEEQKHTETAKCELNPTLFEYHRTKTGYANA